MYSQNNEDKVIAGYFQDYIGTIVDIGANDGKTLSNSLYLIQQGWYAHLIEPNPKSCVEINKLHKENDKVKTYCIGISEQEGILDFYESGSHLSNADHSLLSTLHFKETTKWNKLTNFSTTKAVFLTWSTWLEQNMLVDSVFDFISIDAEGEDWNILKQIDLTAHQCKALCVEWNTKPEIADLYTSYAKSHKMKEVYRNMENIIFVK